MYSYKNLLITTLLLFSTTANSDSNKHWIDDFSQSEKNNRNIESGWINSAKNNSKSKIEKYMEEVQSKTSTNIRKENLKSGAYYFVSFSIPDKALTSMLYDASRFGINPVIAGMHENNMKATTEKILNMIIESGGTFQGMDINPILYDEYKVNSVPALVVYCEGGFDIIRGNVRVKDALKEIKSVGDCKEVAISLLKEVNDEN